MLTLVEEEGDKLNIIKEDNLLLEDLNMIDNCLNKNIFMRNMNKSARLSLLT
jgi:hypothetical protein